MKSRGHNLGGFTLVEILLALGLVVTLGTLMAINLAAWRQGEALDEGVNRLDTLIQMARANAANTGKRLRLDFDAQGQMRITCESQPLTQPGKFADLVGPAWAAQAPNDLVRTVRCDLVGPDSPPPADKGNPTQEMRGITFYPDGSCDGAIIELKEATRDAQHAVIGLDGISGAISRSKVNASDLDAYHQQLQKQQESKG